MSTNPGAGGASLYRLAPKTGSNRNRQLELAPGELPAQPDDSIRLLMMLSLAPKRRHPRPPAKRPAAG